MKITSVFLNAVISATIVNLTAAKLGGSAGHVSDDKNSSTELMEYRKRILQSIKQLWPECESKDAFWCKDKVDKELARMDFPGSESIKSVIIYRRTEESPTYNAVVIQMDDNDMCVGRNEDGMLYYDFPWCGIGEALTDQTEIEMSKQLLKPSKWTSMIEKNPNVSCEGGVIVANNLNIYGGDFDPNTCSTLEGYRKKEETLSTSVNMPSAGCRDIGPWDCTGMTGMDACQMIKHLVPDADTKRNQIECWLSYSPGTVKFVSSQTDTKVRIYARIEGNKVIGVPELKEGSLGPPLPA